MLTAVKGYYDNGHVVLTEQPPLHSQKEVMVTFVSEEPEKKSKKIVLGLLEGKIKISDDFDEPLEDLKDYM
jgi:uncharacterized protein DUF2281